MPPTGACREILNALEELFDSDFRKFIFHLKNETEEPRVRASEVSGKSRVEVTELLVSRCSSGAVDRTVRALRAAGCNYQAQELESRCKVHSKQTSKLTKPGPAPNSHNHSINNDKTVFQKVTKEVPTAKKSPKSWKTVLLFGKYKGESLEWLLQNDPGYAVYVVATHQMERENGNKTQTALMKNKDALAECVSGLPDVVEEVHFYREGLAPVGFGKYKKVTRQDLYNSTEEQEKKYVQWVRSRKKTDGKPELDATKKYILHRDKKAPVSRLHQL